MLDICLLGTGGMMPLPRRHLTSLMVRCSGSTLLIDCGEGTQTAIREKGWSFKPIDTILLTHFPADHIAGLPGLSVPSGFDQAGMPVGTQIIGPALGDADVLNIGYAFQQATEYHKAAPSGKCSDPNGKCSGPNGKCSAPSGKCTAEKEVR